MQLNLFLFIFNKAVLELTIPSFLWSVMFYMMHTAWSKIFLYLNLFIWLTLLQVSQDRIQAQGWAAEG